MHEACSTEEWRPVPGFESRYEVSDIGRVRSLTTGRPMKPRLSNKGYPQVVFVVEGKHKWRRIHRLVLLAFVGPCPVDEEARHLDGDRTNARLTNLKWGTKTENEADRVLHGTILHGESHPQARFTEKDIAVMRRLGALGVAHRRIAAGFETDQSYVSAIIRGERWAAS